MKLVTVDKSNKAVSSEKGMGANVMPIAAQAAADLHLHPRRLEPFFVNTGPVARLFHLFFSNPLLQIPGYRRLWLALLVSSLGGQITMLALPLTAVILLQATPSQMGLLTAMELLPFVFFSLPGGVFLDRRRKFPVFIVGEFLMAVFILILPLAWWVGSLSMPLMYGVAFCLGCVYTVAGSASQIVLVHLVGRDQLVRANAQNALASSFAEVTGPGLAGALIRLLGAPLALVADACMLVGSVVLLRGIRVQEPVPQVPAARSFWAELLQGLQFVRSHRVLLELAYMLGSWQFFAQMALSVQIVYAVRTLGLSEHSTAMAYVATGVGSIAAGAAGPLLGRQWGVGRTLLLGLALTALSWLGALALRPWVDAALLFAAMLLCFSLGATLLYINMISLRQSSTPPSMLGRVNSTMRWLALLPSVPGALIGGWVAEHYGLVQTLALAGSGCLLVTLVFGIRPVLRDILVLPDSSPPGQLP